MYGINQTDYLAGLNCLLFFFSVVVCLNVNAMSMSCILCLLIWIGIILSRKRLIALDFFSVRASFLTLKIYVRYRFEKLDITPKSAQKIKPVLERWMKEAEER